MSVLRTTLVILLALAGTSSAQQQENPDHIPPINVWWGWNLRAYTVTPGSLSNWDFSNVATFATADLTAESITGSDSILEIEGIAGTGTGAGGDIAVTTGAGGTTSGVSGDVDILTGTTQAATSGVASASGAINVGSGAPGTATTGTGGAAGLITIGGAAGGATTGAGGTGGAGAGVNITGAAGGADGEGASGTGGEGGSILLTAGAGGAGNTAGIGGQITLRSAANTPILSLKAVGTGADAETLTVAELFNGIFAQTATGNTTTATPTGTQISAALGSNLAVGDSFEFTIVSIAAFAIELNGAGAVAGVTLFGDPQVSASTSGTWLFINTGANAWSAYRK